jgi:Flp pilus assembly protein TadD
LSHAIQPSVWIFVKAKAVFTVPARFIYHQQHFRFFVTDEHGIYGSVKAAANLISRLLVVAYFFFILAASHTPAQQDTSVNRVERVAELIRDNRVAEAEQQLNFILKNSPKDAIALNLLGTIRAKQGRLDEAETLFSRAISIDNHLIGAHMNLAYLFLLKGMHEKTALELKEVLRLEPNNQDATYRLAWLLFSLGRFDQCISFIKETEQKQALPGALYVVLGDAYLKKGEVDKAEKSYVFILGKEAGNPNALLGMAEVSRARGDAKSAALYLERSKEGVANSADLLYKFALIALSSSLDADARAAIKRAIELRPDEGAYYFVLGQTWLRKPDLYEAEQAFRHSLKLRPDNPSGQMHLGYTLLKQKKNAEAREWLERSVQKDNPTPESFYYLGLIAQEQNEEAQAVKLFEKAIELSPTFASAHIALGSTYMRLKNYPRAQAELEVGVKLSPEDSKAHYNLAMLYARLKDQERAQAEMAIVEKLKSKGKSQEKEDAVTPPPLNPR